MKASETTVQRANIACPSCGQRIDFSLSEPVKAPAPVLTEEAPNEVVVRRHWELAAARKQYRAYRATQEAAKKSSEDYAAWAVSAASVAMNMSELFIKEIDRLTKQPPQPEEKV